MSVPPPELALLSSELRSPLSEIRGRLKFISREPTFDRARKYLSPDRGTLVRESIATRSQSCRTRIPKFCNARLELLPHPQQRTSRITPCFSQPSDRDRCRRVLTFPRVV
jgi:hypothetical protein